MNAFDVVILSVYGRGAWLAGALSRAKKKTAFIDLSQALPAGSDEDLEGPFGFSLLPGQGYLQQEWFKERWFGSPEGFCLLAGQSFFHFKETLLSSVYKKRPEYLELLKYFETGRIDSKPDFKKHWIIHLLRQLNAGIENSEAGPVLPVFEDFGILAYEKNFSSFLPREVFFHQQKDHHFLLPESDRDFVISSRTGQSIKAKYLIFMLTPFETDKLHPSLCRLIFSKKKIIPQETWQRFSFKWDSEGYSFPFYMVIADPYKLPWTKERLLVLKKPLCRKNHINVWARMPFGQQLDSDSSSKDVQNIVLQLEKSFPGFLKEFSPPSSARSDVLFPIYSAEDARKIKHISHPRFFYSFDILDLSPTRQASREKEIFTQIQTMDSSS